MRHSAECPATQAQNSTGTRLFVAGLLALSLTITPRPARAQAVREFVMSSAYGVLAGTLVGAATLAFVDKPGENLNNIARGASIGLYAGMLLGLYVVYGVPSADDPGGTDSDAALNFRSGMRPAGASTGWRSAPQPQGHRFAILPQLDPRNQSLSGASLQVSLVDF